MLMLWEVFATFAEVFMGFYFVSKVIDNKSPNYNCYLLLTVVMTMAVTFANSIKLYSGWTTFFSFLFMAASVYMIEKKQVTDIITLTAFYFVLMLLIDFFVLSVQGILLDKPYLPNYIVSGLSPERCTFLLVSKTCLGIVSIAVGKVFSKFRLTYHSNFIFTIAGTLIVSFLGAQTFQGVNNSIIVSWALFFACAFSVFFLLSIYKAYQGAINEQRILTVRSELLSEQTQKLLESDYEQRKLTHDMQAHLMALAGMLEDGSTREALDYIYTLTDPAVRGQLIAWTGNKMVDFILDCYMRKADKNKILMKIDSDCVQFAGKKEKDLCSIFCNLLDNAFEAMEHVDADKRNIDISIRKFNEIVIIQITNAIVSKPIEKNGRLITSKKNRKLHGLGLCGVEDIVNNSNFALE